MMGKGPAHSRLIEKRQYPLLANQLRDTELLLKKKMHGRQRSLERTQMQNASAEREKAVSSGKIGNDINLSCCHVEFNLDLLPLWLLRWK